MQETNQSGFRLWLCNPRRYQPRPIKDAVSRCRRVERHYGDLDDLYDKDRLVSLLEHLACTPLGECRHRIPFRKGADASKGTASLRSAVKRYQEFRDGAAQQRVRPLPRR